MKFLTKYFHHTFSRPVLYFLGLATLFAGLFYVVSPRVAYADDPSSTNAQRLVTIYDSGNEVTIVTRALTVADALKQAEIIVSPQDIVEPAASEKLVAKSYQVNVFRARPVVVVDGTNEVRIMTAEQSPRQIAKLAGLTLYDEDTTDFKRVDSVLDGGGAGVQMIIHRATVFNFTLYGKRFEARTQAKTVGGLLKEKNITLSAADGVSPSQETTIANGMEVKVWRNGKQTITQEEIIARPVEEVRDTDKPLGFREIKEEGSDGTRNATYEIETQDGVEVSRNEIASVTTKEPVKQVVLVGVKSTGGLTKSKGVNFFTDSNGITHRETYYDLPMSGVMKYCGGGTYTIRADGAKIDVDGYILVAANLSRYARCSVVETSIGLGKVYDTGAFVATYPDGFDLATDWTNNNGN